MNSNRNFTRAYFRASFYGWFRGLLPAQRVPGSPGQVKGAWITASLASGLALGGVTGDFTTAKVRTKSAYGHLTGDTQTAYVATKSKFLVKD